MRWYQDFFHQSPVDRGGRDCVFIATVTADAWRPRSAPQLRSGLNGLRSRFSISFLGILVTPMVVPIVVADGVAIYFLFSILGLVGTLHRDGVALGHAVIAIPYVVITVSGALQGFDQNLPRAAAILGAPPRSVLARVTLR